MPLPSSTVGRALEPFSTYIDARWIMSYAAGLGMEDDAPAVYFDTCRDGSEAKMRPTFDYHKSGMQGAGVVAHPVFVWAVEWPITWTRGGEMMTPDPARGERGLTNSERGRGVHFAQDIVIHRPILAGDELTTTTQTISAKGAAKGSSCVSTTRFDHRDHLGNLVCSTWSTSFHRGVPLEGEGGTLADLMPPPLPPRPLVKDKTQPELDLEIAVSAVDAHIYSECSRIWNPIHTDRAAALAAGLPAIILHGTAVMAKAVSAIIRHYGHGDPASVARCAVGSFGAMVLMPSKLRLVVAAASVQIVHFDVFTERGDAALRGGVVEFRQASELRAAL